MTKAKTGDLVVGGRHYPAEQYEVALAYATTRVATVGVPYLAVREVATDEVVGFVEQRGKTVFIYDRAAGAALAAERSGRPGEESGPSSTASGTPDEPATETEGGGTMSTTTTKPAKKGGSKQATRGKVTAREAAIDVLTKAGKPMHVRDITKAVLATPGVKMAGKTPDATINAMLSVDAKKDDGVFKRTEAATFALR